VRWTTYNGAVLAKLRRQLRGGVVFVVFEDLLHPGRVCRRSCTLMVLDPSALETTGDPSTILSAQNPI
jgi:hypothetical protein